MTDLKNLVDKKNRLGFPTTLGIEMARIVEGYITGLWTGKKTDEELFREYRDKLLRPND